MTHFSAGLGFHLELTWTTSFELWSTRKQHHHNHHHQQTRATHKMPGGLPPAGSLLWRSLRIYQVYGANTEVGKTIFTTLLCKAAKSRPPGEETVFLKPVSTGPDNEADEKCKDPYFAVSFVLGLLND